MNKIERAVQRYVGALDGDAERALTKACRAANSYSRIQERWASEEMDDRTVASLERRETNLMRRIDSLVATLPAPNRGLPDVQGEGRWEVWYEGDPRGHTVKMYPLWPGETPGLVGYSRYVGLDS